MKEYGGGDMREDLKTRLQGEIAEKFERETQSQYNDLVLWPYLGRHS